MQDVIIVGGSVAGLTTAIKILEVNPRKDVLILESRPQVGQKACSGGISAWLIDDLIQQLDIPQLKDAIVSRIRKVKLVSPGGTEVVVDGEAIKIDPLGYVFDREKFDGTLANVARGLGASIITSSKVKGYSDIQNASFTVMTDTMNYHTKYLVGADGVFSIIGKQSGLIPPTDRGDIHTAVEHFLERPESEPDEQITLRFDERYAPGGYTWHFPHGNDIIKIGCGVPISIGHPNEYLEKYISKYFPLCKRIKTIGGCLPTAKPLPKSVRGNIALVGDASFQCDSLTGGDIATGMGCACILGETIAKDRPLTEYDSLWRKSIGKLLHRRYKLKKMLYSLKQGEIDDIADTLAGYQVKSANPRREITKGLLHVLMRHPKILWRYWRA